MHPFDQDTLLTPLSARNFQVDVTGNWSINGNPNGGYLMALMARAMKTVSSKPSLTICTASYLGRCSPGGAEIQVEPIGLSKSFDRLQARLLQGGMEKVRAWGTFMDDPPEGRGENRHEKSAPDLAPRDTCVQIPPLGEYTLYRRMNVRLDPRCAGWFAGSLVHISEHRGWIRFEEERPFDAISVLLAADSFPPPVFASSGMSAWVPTIEFSINIRGLPSTRWLKCIFRTHFIHNGILEEDGEIWDEDGGLVAISRQIAQFRKKSV